MHVSLVIAILAFDHHLLLLLGLSRLEILLRMAALHMDSQILDLCAANLTHFDLFWWHGILVTFHMSLQITEST